MAYSGPAASMKEAPPDEQTEWLNPGHRCRGVNRVSDTDAGRVELLMPDGTTPRRKFALIGFATSSRYMAPLDDPEWAVVGMNQLSRHLMHATADENGDIELDDEGKVVPTLRHGDLWFEIHKLWNTAVVPGSDHAGFLRDCQMPVYMTDVVDEIPTSVAYPVDRFIEKFDLDYFTSTVAFMFAWVIDHIDYLVEQRLREDKTRRTAVATRKLVREMYAEYTVGVFGIDLAVGEEYVEQRPCAEYWLGQAMARNITFMISDKSALLMQRYRYGYDMEPPDLLRESDFENRKKTLADEHRAVAEKVIELYGRLAELEEGPRDEEAIKKRHAELMPKHQESSQKAMMLAGALGEGDYWYGLRQLRERGAGVE